MPPQETCPDATGGGFNDILSRSNTWDSSTHVLCLVMLSFRANAFTNHRLVSFFLFSIADCTSHSLLALECDPHDGRRIGDEMRHC